jgi:hypothetical protein
VDGPASRRKFVFGIVFLGASRWPPQIVIRYAASLLVHSNAQSRMAAKALGVACLVPGTVCLGLGKSVLDYIEYERTHGHPAPASTVHECTMFFVLGLVFCIAGILLWLYSKQPAV